MPVEYRLIDWSQLPDWAQLSAPNAGAYAWKPFIIHTVAKENHELLIWCDAGNLIQNIKALEDHVRSVNLYTPHSSGTIQCWTHDACIKGMELPEHWKALQMRNAACVGLVPSDPTISRFIEDWKICALNPELSVGSRDNHRHDQSILTCLFYKYERTCDNNYIHFSIHNDCD